MHAVRGHVQIQPGAEPPRASDPLRKVESVHTLRKIVWHADKIEVA